LILSLLSPFSLISIFETSSLSGKTVKMATPTNQAAWINEKNAKPLEVKEAPYTKPAANELVIKNAAVAINPMDWMLQETGHLAFTWIKYPFVLGADMAGEVVEVGSEVTRFRAGDRVLAMGCGSDQDRNNAAEGAFQKYAVVLEIFASPIPSTLAFPDAAVLPLGVSTAAAGLFQEDFLNLQLPTVPPQAPTGKALLIWGGSTSVGSNAIQLAAAAGYEVFTTASPKNFDYVKKLGASQVFDYNSKTIVKDLVTALKDKTVAGAYAIGVGSLSLCVDVISKTKGVKFVTDVGSTDIPTDKKLAGFTLIPFLLGTMSRGAALWVKTKRTGVRTKFVYASDIKKNSVSKSIYADFLPQALAEGRYLAAPEPQVVGHGLENVQEGFEQLKKGVSAKKLVVTL
jgi:NADPH:quinone reductase-like Zn-dependent oxidoreductase